MERDQAFGPGLLDLVAYDAEQLEAKTGFILDTRLLTEEVLESTPLGRDDSAVSDHLMLVADFGVRSD